MSTLSPSRRATKQLRRKGIFHEHAVALGLAGALLSYGLGLTGDSAAGRFGTEDWIETSIREALLPVYATMIQIPRGDQAIMVAGFMESIPSLKQQNQSLAFDLQQFKLDQSSVLKDLMQEIRRLISINKNLTRDLGLFISNDENWKRTTALVDTRGGHSYDPNTRLREINAQVVRALKGVRSLSLRSKREQIATFDVEKRTVTTEPPGEVIRLDPGLNLMIVTAASEIIGDKRGRIRFYPDGKSTGGRINVELHGAKAAVHIDWATGEVSADAVEYFARS